jgi:hypothetical protein
LPGLKLKFLSTVFIHEGAKTAWFLSLPEHKRTEFWKRQYRDWMEEWRDRCPWAADLTGNSIQQVAHIGWAGGAPNPHRVDWSPIKVLPPFVKVIVVLDHDGSGENAISYISHELQRRVWACRFGKDFPHKFDLSDPSRRSSTRR